MMKLNEDNAGDHKALIKQQQLAPMKLKNGGIV